MGFHVLHLIYFAGWSAKYEDLGCTENELINSLLGNTGKLWFLHNPINPGL